MRGSSRPKARKGRGARKSEVGRGYHHGRPDAEERAIERRERQAGKREAMEHLRAPVDQRVEARYAALLAEPGTDLAWVRALVAAARSLP